MYAPPHTRVAHQVFENAKRIFREIRILHLLDHPNVVKIVHLQQPK